MPAVAIRHCVGHERPRGKQTWLVPGCHCEIGQSSNLAVWSAGCSNGSEAYSVALILEEVNHWSKHVILGTDIDEASLARARAGGPYRPTDVRNVPANILDK